MILNSTANVKGVQEVIGKYRALILGLDNDKAGNLARRRIESSFEGELQTLKFSAKDLSEAFCKGERVSLKR